VIASDTRDLSELSARGLAARFKPGTSEFQIARRSNTRTALAMAADLISFDARADVRLDVSHTGALQPTITPLRSARNRFDITFNRQ